jgi:hypothetical protein
MQVESLKIGEKVAIGFSNNPPIVTVKAKSKKSMLLSNKYLTSCGKTIYYNQLHECWDFLTD